MRAEGTRSDILRRRESAKNALAAMNETVLFVIATAQITLLFKIDETQKCSTLMTVTQNSMTAIFKQPERVSVALALQKYFVEELNLVNMIGNDSS
jgi:hypothetical protein